MHPFGEDGAGAGSTPGPRCVQRSATAPTLDSRPMPGTGDRLLDLHHGEGPLLLANVWDVGSARIVASLGYAALATTSAGHAATLGRRDYRVTRDEALAHAQQLVAATELPVSADLENGFADEPADVAETVTLAAATGLAGCSIEDHTGDPDRPIYALEHAVARVAAAADAARRGPRLVLTARAENHLWGRDDLDDTIRRLVAFRDAGADCLYAPGLKDLDAIRRVVDAVAAPVNVLTYPGGPTVAELAAAGVARVSVGGAFAFAAYGALVEAATELRDEGTIGFLQRARAGGAAARTAFTG